MTMKQAASLPKQYSSDCKYCERRSGSHVSNPCHIRDGGPDRTEYDEVVTTWTYTVFVRIGIWEV